MLASLLLLGVDATTFPPYKPTVLRSGYRLVGVEPEPSEPIGQIYQHALSFFDRVVQECLKRGVELRDRLDAQGVLWVILNVALDQVDDPDRLSAFRGRTGVEVWWVNQGQTYEQERTGGFVWAPQRTDRGAVLGHWLNVSKLAKGDVVVHYANGQIRAIGSVTTDAVEAQKPTELGDSWGSDGYQAIIKYFDLANPIRLSEIPEAVRTAEAGAFNRNGGVNQGYLFPVSADFAIILQSDFEDRWPIGSPWFQGVTEPSFIDVSFADVVGSVSDGLLGVGLGFGGGHVGFVRSFVVSLATKGFVLLTGLSGSGKSRLGLGFGQWLGGDRVWVEAVRPDWTGPDALLGFEDGLSERVGGRLGWQVPDVLEFMLGAAADPSHPYLLLLDEMNLAHVERYFADVLSGMESGAPVLPNLVRGVDGVWREAEGEPRLPFPRNLMVVGTVNIDETTYMFSPKVLDRANTLEFRVATGDLVASASPIGRVEAGSDELVAAFLDAVSSVGGEWSGRDVMAGWLRELHELLAGADREFGHRVFYESLRFGGLLAKAGESDPRVALDLQVMQKILPRVHGSIRQVGSTLERLGAWCYHGPGVPLPDIFDPLDPPEGEPALPVSFDKISRMTRRLRANHFVSYAE